MKAKKCNSGVYGFRNVLNDKWYVGSSTYIPTRKSHHRQDLEKLKHHSAKFQNAWNLYGAEAFEFSILEEVPIPEGMSKLEFKPIILAREDYWTEKYDAVNNGYNIAKKAGSCLGVKRSKECREAASISNKARWAIVLEDPEVAANVKVKMGQMAKEFWEDIRKDPVALEAYLTKRNKPKSSESQRRSLESRLKGAASRTGQKRTEETKTKMTESALKSWDGRRGLPAAKEHVDKRQAGRNKTRAEKQATIVYMAMLMHVKGEVFSKEIDNYLIEIGKAHAEEIRLKNEKSSRDYAERKRREKQASQPQQ